MRRFDQPGRSPVYAENGMAATSHPLATATALAVLKEGGNAVDAALAASATLCVVEPHMTGIAGDCFVILTEPDGTVHGLNGSGRAPSSADAAWYRENGHSTMPQSGALSVTVPGSVDAWWRLSERFGSMEMERLFADAIRYAEDGFAVHPRVARDWRVQVDALRADEGCLQHCLIDGDAPAVGSRFRFPALARTLRTVAKNGPKAFYQGEIGAEIVKTVQSKGGFLSESDLLAVEAEWVTPVSVRYGGHEVLEIPPSGQGITALILLRLMEIVGIRDLDPASAQRYHLEIEAARLAYSVRDHLVADPEAMTRSVDELLSDKFIDALASQLQPDRRNPSIVLPERPRASTVYLSVVDRDRRAVSFINSVYSAFGAKIATPKSGIVLQNRGGCFSIEEGHPNEIGGGKRPMHTIIPAMAMQDGQASVSFGVMGGDYQPMGHARVFSNLVDFGMDPQEALDFPRLFWGDDGVLDAEVGVRDAVRRDLEAMGHQVRDASAPHGGAQMVSIDRGGFLIGASDPRKDGCALGW